MKYPVLLSLGLLSVSGCWKKSHSHTPEKFDQNLIRGAWRLQSVYNVTTPATNLKGSKDDLLLFQNEKFTHFDLAAREYTDSICRLDRPYTVGGDHISLVGKESCEVMLFKITKLDAKSLELEANQSGYRLAFGKIDDGQGRTLIDGAVTAAKLKLNGSQNGNPVQGTSETGKGTPTTSDMGPEPLRPTLETMADAHDQLKLKLLVNVGDGNFGDASCARTLCVDGFGRTRFENNTQIDPTGADHLKAHCELTLDAGRGFGEREALKSIPLKTIFTSVSRSMFGTLLMDTPTEVTGYDWEFTDEASGNEARLMCHSTTNLLGKDPVQFMKEAVAAQASNFISLQ